MAEAADRRHGAADDAAQQRRAAAREQAVVRQRLGEAHGDAGAERGGEADHEGLPVVVGGEGGGEQRRQRRDGTVHQAGEAGLHVLQHELLAALDILAALGGAVEVLLLQRADGALVGLLHGGEIVEQAAGGDVAGLPRRALVVGGGSRLARRHLAPDRLQRLVAHQPHRTPRAAALNVLAPDRHEVGAEAPLVGGEQVAPVAVLDLRHALEHLGRRRVAAVQVLGEIGVDARVLLLRGDSDGKDFALVEVGETLHGEARCLELI